MNGIQISLILHGLADGNFDQTLVVEVDEDKKIKRTYLLSGDTIKNLNPQNDELVSILEVEDIRNDSKCISGRPVNGSDKNVITFEGKSSDGIKKAGISEFIPDPSSLEFELAKRNEDSDHNCTKDDLYTLEMLNSSVCDQHSLSASRQMDCDETVSTMRSPSVILGVKNGKRFVDDQGYTYYHHSTASSRRRLRCVFANNPQFRCPAKASVPLEPDDTPVELMPANPGHNHPAETKETLGSKFIVTLKNRVRNEPGTSIREIYEDECKKIPELGRVLPTNVALPRMWRFRRIRKQLVEPKKERNLSYNSAPKASTELEITHRGRVVYIDHEGYHYHQQCSTKNMRQLRCTFARKSGVEKCSARASMALNPRFAPIYVTGKHNHPPEDTSASTFLNNIKRRARLERSSIREIYDDEALRFPESAAEYPYGKVKRAMQRLRKQRNNSQLDREGIECSDDNESANFEELVTTECSQIGETSIINIQNPEMPVSSALLQISNTAVYGCPYCPTFFDCEESLKNHILAH